MFVLLGLIALKSAKGQISLLDVVKGGHTPKQGYVKQGRFHDSKNTDFVVKEQKGGTLRKAYPPAKSNYADG